MKKTAIRKTMSLAKAFDIIPTIAVIPTVQNGIKIKLTQFYQDFQKDMLLLKLVITRMKAMTLTLL